ncbi:putative Mitochondrial distribution and morphology protein 12 [Glarea lozoyensis 74030]|uniref:Putative Mitochondrial distribution and morphology protein 12 n=1 Tax=Glarea lozoyensis (strain ATCC 74030 / MF5533) TaxID=1104152 RepID=H0ECL4_GLAL7|nr:putative Mitochondrial distribution and morphology protein 12 [Glarea lozoyensis 74030]
MRNRAHPLEDFENPESKISRPFVGIPVKLNITGLSFDGVAVLAYIRKKAHFCFLSPEDACTAVGAEEDESEHRHDMKLGGLIHEIKVESEIGQQENGKQVLKNVGKVENSSLFNDIPLC